MRSLLFTLVLSGILATCPAFATSAHPSEFFLSDRLFHPPHSNLSTRPLALRVGQSQKEIEHQGKHYPWLAKIRVLATFARLSADADASLNEVSIKALFKEYGPDVFLNEKFQKDFADPLKEFFFAYLKNSTDLAKLGTDEIHDFGADGKVIVVTGTDYRVPNGLRFWKAFVDSLPADNLKLKAAGLTLVEFLAESSGDFSLRLIAGLLVSPSSSFYLILNSDTTAEEAAVLGAIRKSRRLEASNYGRYTGIGSGIPFHAMHSQMVWKKAALFNDPTISRFLDHIAQKAIPIVYQPKNPNIVAFYSSGDENIGISWLSAMKVAYIVHESAHAWLEQFIRTMGKRVEDSKWAVPYEVSGSPLTSAPTAGDTGYDTIKGGGIYLLLNEFHSWRNQGAEDQKKLKPGDPLIRDPADKVVETLVTNYQGETGIDTLNEFQKYWPIKTLEETEVPTLIENAITGLNQKSDADAIKYGQAALKETDPLLAKAQKMNFIRLARARFVPLEDLVKTNAGLAKSVSDILKTLAGNQAERPEIRREALHAFNLKHSDLDLEKHVTNESAAAMAEFHARALKWIEEVAKGNKEIQVVPFELKENYLETFQMASELCSAQDGAIPGYDACIDQLRSRFGDLFLKDPDERHFYEVILATEGDKVDGRIQNYLCTWNKRPFDEVFGTFMDMAAHPNGSRQILYEGQLLACDANALKFQPAQFSNFLNLASSTRTENSVSSAARWVIERVLTASGLSGDPQKRAAKTGDKYLGVLDDFLAARFSNFAKEFDYPYAMGLITEHTRPEELPKLKDTIDKNAKVIVHNQETEEEGPYLALMVLKSSDGKTGQDNLWAIEVHDILASGPAETYGNTQLLHAMTDYLRLVRNPAAKDVYWGEVASSKLDATARGKLLKAGIPDSVKKDAELVFGLFRRDSWTGSPVSFDYFIALVTNPQQLLVVEAGIAEEIESNLNDYTQVLAINDGKTGASEKVPDEAVRQVSRKAEYSIRLASVVERGFLPKVDAVLDHLFRSKDSKLDPRLKTFFAPMVNLIE